MTCTHQDKYQSAGLLPIETPSGMFLIAVLYCTGCGAVELKANKIEVKGKPPAKPEEDFRSREEKMYDEKVKNKPNEQTEQVDKSKTLDNSPSGEIGQDHPKE